jgi:hypothetical protein
VGKRLVVLGLGQRVDRPELLAAALQALDPRAQALGGRRVQRFRRRLGLQPQPLRERPQLLGGVVLGVAGLLGANLGGGDRLPTLAQARLDLRLLGRARAQLGGDTLTGLAVGGELGVEDLDPRAHRGQRALEDLDQAARGGQQRAVALERALQPFDPRGPLGPLASGALGHALLGGELALQLGAAHRRLALVGRLAPLLDQPCRPALLLGRLSAGAVGIAQRAVGLVTGGVGGLDRR